MQKGSAKLYIYLNPDKEEVSAIRRALKENNGYCPCRVAHTDETKCMCKEFRESEDEGYCHCGLYYKATIPRVRKDTNIDAKS
jgi:ferredoxin-thioredoxin reductase catalytic subunit